VAAGSQREALLWVADQLCAELGYPEGETEASGARSRFSGDGSGGSGILNPEDESLVAMVRRSLEKVAAATGAKSPEGAPESAVSAALDGSEMMMRGELASGNAEQLPSLMPSFVFLVTLPIVDQDEALYLSHRTSELIEKALGR